MKTTDLANRFTTALGSVRGHTLYVECGACGRAAELTLAVVDLPDDTTLASIIARLRCTQCCAQAIRDARLIWQGESWGALRGTRTTLDD